MNIRVHGFFRVHVFIDSNIDFTWTREIYVTLVRTGGVTAQVDELVGPVALLDPVVVGQARVAWQRVRRAVFALDVVGAARGSVRVQAELVLAPGRADRRHCGTNEKCNPCNPCTRVTCVPPIRTSL